MTILLRVFPTIDAAMSYVSSEGAPNQRTALGKDK